MPALNFTHSEIGTLRFLLSGFDADDIESAADAADLASILFKLEAEPLPTVECCCSCGNVYAVSAMTDVNADRRNFHLPEYVCRACALQD